MSNSDKIAEFLMLSTILGVVLGLFFSQALFPNQILSPADHVFASPFFNSTASPDFVRPSNVLLFDQVYQFTPWRYFSWQTLNQGELPLWNPYSSSGTPFVATMQSAVFYPLNLLLTPFPLEQYFLISAFLRLFITGISCYYLAIYYSLSPMSALVSSISFMLCGYLIVWLGHPQSNVAIWLPLSILLTEMMIQTQHKVKLIRLTALLALITGIQISGGHLATSFNIILTLILYWIIRSAFYSQAVPTFKTSQKSLAEFVEASSPSTGSGDGGRSIFLELPQNRSWRAKFVHYLLPISVALSLGISLGSIQLIPFFEWFPLSAEIHRRDIVDWHITLFDTGLWRELLKLPLFLFPNLYNNPTWNDHLYWPFLPWSNYNESTTYIGIFPLILAVVALLTSWRSQPLVRTWAFIALVSFGRIFHLPPFDWLNQLPILDAGSPDRLRLILSFSLSVLAGFGMQKLWHFKDTKINILIDLNPNSPQKDIPFSHRNLAWNNAQKIWLGGCLFIVSMGLLIGLSGNLILPMYQEQIITYGQTRVDRIIAVRGDSLQHPAEHYYTQVEDMVAGLLAVFRVTNVVMYLPILWGLTGLFYLFMLRRGNKLRINTPVDPNKLEIQNLLRYSIVWVIVLDLVSFGYDYNPTISAEQFYPSTTISQRLTEDQSLFRMTALRQDLIPDAHIMFGLSDVRGLDLPIHWYKQYVNLIPERIPWLHYGLIFDDVDSPLLRVLNLKYVVAGKPDKLVNNEHVTNIEQIDELYLAELKTVTPRAFMVYETIISPNDDHTTELLQQEPEAVFRRVILAETTSEWEKFLNLMSPAESISDSAPPSLEQPTETKVVNLTYQPNHSSWQVRTPQAGYLFLSDAYYPGWWAEVNGHPTKIYRANLAFRAIYLPPGEHTVNFRFQPLSFYLGGGISVMALGLILALLAWSAREFREYSL
ncbi:YfhO family protein [Anaerolineales bacterium HSG25]|nr:YfhO family protein [Anaerolineales bacterium HSG25]